MFSAPGRNADWAGTISSFGNGVLRPALTSLITRAAGRHEQGAVLGITQSLMSIAQIAVPGFAGLLIEYGYLAGWALLSAVTALVGLALNVRHKSGVEASGFAATEVSARMLKVTRLTHS